MSRHSSKITLTCKQCQKEFKVKASHQHRQFCGTDCSRKGQKYVTNRTTHVCAWCQVEFTVIASNLKQKYCSRTCVASATKKIRALICKMCGKEFTAPSSQKLRKFCSVPCHIDWCAAFPRDSSAYKNCAFCGKSFKVLRCELKDGKKRFCSTACANKGRDQRVPTLERFWAYIEKSPNEDGCWMWTGAPSVTSGYGKLVVDGKSVPAHRFSWELRNGAIPPGMRVCHSCDKNYPVGDITYRRCVNPKHLWLGTPKENTQDAVAKGRMARGERASKSKFKNADVVDIRKRVAGGERLKAVAKEYGVWKETIWKIVKRITYSDVP